MLDEDDIDNLFVAIDTNHDGVIEYTEFLAVFMDNYIFKNERYLRMAFEKFDLVNLLTLAFRLTKSSNYRIRAERSAKRSL
mgnify:CR=1 FL=1